MLFAQRLCFSYFTLHVPFQVLQVFLQIYTHFRCIHLHSFLMLRKQNTTTESSFVLCVCVFSFWKTTQFISFHFICVHWMLKNVSFKYLLYKMICLFALRYFFYCMRHPLNSIVRFEKNREKKGKHKKAITLNCLLVTSVLFLSQNLLKKNKKSYTI